MIAALRLSQMYLLLLPLPGLSLSRSVLSVRDAESSGELRVLSVWDARRSRSASTSSAFGRDFDFSRAFLALTAAVYSVGAVVVRWISPSSSPPSTDLRDERRVEDVRRVLRLWRLDIASISSMAAKSGDIAWSAGVGARDPGAVGRLEGGSMALSVGVGSEKSGSGALGWTSGALGVESSVEFGSDLCFPSNSAARMTMDAGGAPRTLSVGTGRGGASRGVS